MNEIIYHNNFVKNFRKRIGNDEKLKKQFIYRTKLFLSNRSSPILKDDSLKGKKINLRAFSITGDIRIVYYIQGKKGIFLDIGTHNQVY